jgi:hypothetical protein
MFQIRDNPWLKQWDWFAKIGGGYKVSGDF